MAASLSRPQAFRGCTRSQARSVRCSANVVDRRALLAATATLPALLAPSAWALIPDEEDEELLERAKANRQKRLASQKETTREFLKQEGLTNKTLNAELIPVQKAVFQLAKSGSELEAGDLRAVSSTLGGSWVGDFQRAAASLDASDEEAASAQAIFDGISSLKSSAGSGDLNGSKRQYVALVGAVTAWASSTGLASDLKGL